MNTAIEKEFRPERKFTVDEFEQLLHLPANVDRLLELIDGKVVEKTPTLQQGFIAATLVAAINNFALECQLGWAVVEGHHGVPEDPNNSFLPDISYVTADRPMVEDGIAPFMPDLAIEIKSPRNTMKQMREKAQYYLANGSKLVWLLYPQHRMIEVYSPDEDDKILFGTDQLTGGDLLLGFAIAVADVFATPAERFKSSH